MSNITTLNGLAETIFSGLTAYGRSPIRNSGVPVAMINITDIQRGNLDLTELETVYADEAAKLERYQVKAGDVLITAKGSSFKSAVVPETPNFMILSSNLCAIRLKSDSPISPALLQAWLESPAGLGQLQIQSQGSSILNLRPKGLGEIQIPLPTAQQAQTLNALVETYRISINSARSALESRQKIALSVIQQVFEKAALNG